MRSVFGDLVFSLRPCFFPLVLHLYCPGCGGTRAVNYLLEGRVVESLLANPVPVCCIPVVFRVWGALLYNCISGYKKKLVTVFSVQEIWVVLVAYIGYGIIRNLMLIFLHIDYLGDLVEYWQ
ncbi:MAG: DUF2752 domain-containing protein [Lachnospiraceae bacterium]|nr:DUF2752 domain-containing protein [Lachnospiraceae bacterium]